MTIWLISDTHFSHEHMCSQFKLADGSPARKFASAKEMDETIIENWNSKVRPSDHVYHLGDLSMARGSLPGKRLADILKRLNGHKRLVLGNHDAMPAKWYLANGFEKLFGVRVIDRLVLTHIPIAPWCLGRFKANVHGHVHTNAPKVYWETYTHSDSGLVIPVFYVNLSVEAIDYTPVSLEEVQSWLS